MSVQFEEQSRHDEVMRTARRMLLAARTAPKARGVDNIVAAVVEGDDLRRLADEMVRMAEKDGASPSFVRDAGNLLQAEAVVLIGTTIKSTGLAFCGLCGFASCAEREKHPETPCALNTGDLGIAIGSAVSVAMDERVDNRIMYSVGMAARKLGMLGQEARIIYGIPLSATGKNPFFDRPKLQK